jgi:hypothetical protein
MQWRVKGAPCAMLWKEEREGTVSRVSGEPTCQTRMRKYESYFTCRRTALDAGAPDCTATSDGRLLLALTQLRLTIVLDTDALDEIELGFEIVDVLFLGLEDGLEELAGDEVAV